MDYGYGCDSLIYVKRATNLSSSKARPIFMKVATTAPTSIKQMIMPIAPPTSNIFMDA